MNPFAVLLIPVAFIIGLYIGTELTASGIAGLVVGNVEPKWWKKELMKARHRKELEELKK